MKLKRQPWALTLRVDFVRLKFESREMVTYYDNYLRDAGFVATDKKNTNFTFESVNPQAQGGTWVHVGKGFSISSLVMDFKDYYLCPNFVEKHDSLYLHVMVESSMKALGVGSSAFSTDFMLYDKRDIYGTKFLFEPNTRVHSIGMQITGELQDEIADKTGYVIPHDLKGPQLCALREMVRDELLSITQNAPQEYASDEDYQKLLVRIVKKMWEVEDESAWKMRAGIHAVKQHLIEHYDNPPKLDDLCELCLMSKSSLQDHFKKETGKSITEFVKGERIKNACILLDSSNLPVDEIGEAVGYQSHSTFSRVFKQFSGMTPTNWRNLHALAIAPQS